MEQQNTLTPHTSRFAGSFRKFAGSLGTFSGRVHPNVL